MVFKQFYLNCLAHASYLIADGGEAAIVDPQRDVDQYIEEAGKLGARVKYVIETHLHADFVSGHRELAARTGAEIVIGAEANAAFPHRAVRDGDELQLGPTTLRAMETPGHTPESVSWLVVEDGQPKRVLTGDTLFIGDVGRPDLAGGRGYTSAMMAAMMHDSLHNKLLALPDDVEVWPAHGAGSACGRNISKESSSTIGVQRRTNYALKPMTRDEFVKLMTTDVAAAPAYFTHDAEMNRKGARPLAEITAAPMTASAVRDAIANGAVVLDVRDANAFGSSHITNAINIGLGGQFASWAGTVIPVQTPIVISADTEAQAAEAVMRLARVGMENVAGYITDAADLPRASLAQINVTELRDVPVLDVRGPGEYASGHIPGARSVPLPELPNRIAEIDHGPLAVICGGGYRSSLAASLLMRNGHTNLVNVRGGMSSWSRAGLPVAT
jgi:glyoxylase-like metal-dependent hydrolase (beta-lactamase superfamily II)/rhodanese-related sulfurtransferase